MKIRKEKLGLAAAAFAAVFIVAGASGCNNNEGSTTQSGSENKSTAQVAAVTKASDLRNVLNTLEKEHVQVAVATLTNAYDADPATAAYKARLLANNDELAKAVESVYGSEAGAQFKEIFLSHLVFFENYTVAAKAGNKAGMDKAVADLTGYTEAIGNFFGKANPNLPAADVTKLFQEHVALLKGAIDGHAGGDFTKEVQQTNAANTQVGTIADATATAIVKQKPEMFQ